MRKISLAISATLIFTLVPITGAFAESYVPTAIVEITASLEYPSDIATAPNGDIWWSDWGQDKLFLFDKNTTGSSLPKKEISVRSTPNGAGDVSSVAIDQAGFVYALDANASTPGYIRIFNPTLGDSQTASDAVRTISFARRGRAIAVDSAGYIYVASSSPTGGHLQVRVFAPGVTGNESADPVWSFIDLDTSVNEDAYGLAVNSRGEVVVANDVAKSIRVYAPNSDGTALREISGSHTMLSSGCSLGRIRIDSEDRIYASHVWCGPDTNILIFNGDASGNTAPSDVIAVTENQSLAAFTLSSDSALWFATENVLIQKISNPLTFHPVQVITVDPIKSARVTAEKKLAAVAEAKTAIIGQILSNSPLTAEGLAKADIPGATAENIGAINTEIATLPIADRTNINEIKSILFKYETVDRIAEHKTVSINSLIQVGLVPATSKQKASILLALSKLPSNSVDTFAEVAAVVAQVEKAAADRRARLSARLGR